MGRNIGMLTLFGLMLAMSLSFAGNYPVAPMTYTAHSADTYRVATAPGDVACGASSSQDWQYTVKMVEMSSSEAIFGGLNDSLPGDYTFDRIYYDPVGITGNGSYSLNGTANQSFNQAYWIQRVFFMMPGRDCYNWISLGTVGLPNGSKLLFFIAPYNGLPQANNFIAIMENAETGIVEYSAIPVTADNINYSTLRFKEESGVGAVYYGKNNSSYFMYEPPFTTERGTVYNSVGVTDVSVSLAKEVAKPSFVFRGKAGMTSAYQPHKFSTLITDTVDRTLQNRQNTLAEDEYPSLLSDVDTGGAITSPLRAVEEGTQKAKNLYRIGSAQYGQFVDAVVVDGQSPMEPYLEKQAFFVGTTPNGVKYDASSNVKDVIVNKYSAMAYSAKFEGNDFGIPVCTGDLEVGDDWTSCELNTNGTSETDRHRVAVKFMDGKEWIISRMEKPASQLESATAAINGGEIKLAKESAYGIYSVGQVLESMPFDVRLEDVTNSTQCENGEYPAIFSILKQNGVMVGQIMVCPDSTYTFTQAYTGKVQKVHVYKTGYGATPAEKWAEFATYSDEITLKDGHRYNLVSSTDPDKNFKVSLLWKNKDYAGAGSSTQPDSLREIVVYNVDGLESKVLKGGVVPFMVNKPVFKLKYAGITPVYGKLSPTTSSTISSEDEGMGFEGEQAISPSAVAIGASAR